VHDDGFLGRVRGAWEQARKDAHESDEAKSAVEPPEIDMPPDPASPTEVARAAATAGAEAAHEHAVDLHAISQSFSEVASPAVLAAENARLAANKAAANNAPDAADRAAEAGLAKDVAEALNEPFLSADRAAVDARALAKAANVDAAEAALKDAAGDASAASTAALNDVTKGIKAEDPGAVENAMHVSDDAHHAAEAARAIEAGFREAAAIAETSRTFGEVPASEDVWPDDEVYPDASRTFGEVEASEDVWPDDGF
jgi:hypothetical protein